MDAAVWEALVQQMTGSLAAQQQELLPGLRRGAEQGLRAQLRSGAAGYEEVLEFAAALLVSGWLQTQTPERFTAGDFSVSRDGTVTERTALLILKPWLAEPFAFRKV